MVGRNEGGVVRVSKGASTKRAVQDVEEFLRDLKHGRKGEIEAVREIILSVDRDLTERIKWNAPSYCVDGDDRITFKLQPKECVQLVFHRGAKKRDDTISFRFEDNTGLLEWVAGDRALVTFRDLDDVKAKRAGLKELVARWVDATRSGSGEG